MVAGEGLGGRKWRVVSTREVVRTPVFTLMENESESPEGKRGAFSVLRAPDWATVVPLVDGPDGPSFLMVRQYRHGSGEISVEFPGGVVEKDEKPEDAAARELLEETGCKAQSIIRACSVRPNPALMDNHFNVFFATGLSGSGGQKLDPNEVLDAFLVPVSEVEQKMGTPPFDHALMAVALFFAERLMKERS